MARIYAADQLTWKGDQLVVRGAGRHTASAEVIPDDRWAGMWRVRCPDGCVTDMVNRVRTRDGAKSILRAVLNSQETPQERPSGAIPDPPLSEASRMKFADLVVILGAIDLGSCCSSRSIW